jgi:2-hydroxychromene-2-carboxylate isomerase
VILVDDARWPWRGRRWAHLVSDESYDELHRFAERLGLPRRIFQGDHYDVPTEIRAQAIRLGAMAVNSRELVMRLRDAGLRQRPPARRSHPPDSANRP